MLRVYFFGIESVEGQNMPRTSLQSVFSQSSHSYGSPRHGSSGNSRRRVTKNNQHNHSQNRQNRIEDTLLRNGPGVTDNIEQEIHRAQGISAEEAILAIPSFSTNINTEEIRVHSTENREYLMDIDLRSFSSRPTQPLQNIIMAANPTFSPAAGANTLLRLESDSSNYAPADLYNFDLNNLNNITDLSEQNNTFSSVILNASIASISGLRCATDRLLQPLHVISRKRLRDIITQGNNNLFSFLKNADNEKTPVFGSSNSSIAKKNFGEYLLKKYGADLATLKYLNREKDNSSSKDFTIDTNIKTCLNQIQEELSKKSTSESTVENLIQQLRWVTEELTSIGDNIIRLESQISKKMQNIDLISGRANFLGGLQPSSGYTELLDAFSTYVEKLYHDNKIEDDYRELLELYKKWIILKDITGLQKCIQLSSSNTSNGQYNSTNGGRLGSNEPLCTICLNEPITHAVVPCGHTFCLACIKKQTMTCYICRGVMKDRIKIFIT